MLKLETQLRFALYGAVNAITRTYRPLLSTAGLNHPGVIAAAKAALGCRSRPRFAATSAQRQTCTETLAA